MKWVEYNKDQKPWMSILYPMTETDQKSIADSLLGVLKKSGLLEYNPQLFYALRGVSKKFRSVFSDYYPLAGRLRLDMWVYRLIYRLKLYKEIIAEVIPKKTFDDKCRYIEICGLYGSIRIDKVTGLILDDDCRIPRGYIFDSEPELNCTADEYKNQIVAVSTKNIDKKKLANMKEEYKSATEMLKKIPRLEKKELLMNRFTETEIRKHKLEATFQKAKRFKVTKNKAFYFSSSAVS